LICLANQLFFSVMRLTHQNQIAGSIKCHSGLSGIGFNLQNDSRRTELAGMTILEGLLSKGDLRA